MSALATKPRLCYTQADSERANETWKATCGPHSVAAALGITLEQVRAVLVNYKGWMSPTQIGESLRALGKTYQLRHNLKTSQLCNGINRIQWEGAWLNPGVHPRVAYFHTHWVAHFDGWVLCTACETSEWIPEEEWRQYHLTVPPVSHFHITHHYHLSPPIFST